MQRGRQGFTIIEVMLFLAVSGLIMSVVLSGVTVGINRERYRDAVNSYYDFWQQQYSSTANVINNRSHDNPCVGNHIINDGHTIDAGRGTSDCTVVGRLVHSVSGGDHVTVAPVYSTVDPDSLPLHTGDTDSQVLQDARLISDPTSESHEIGWGTHLVAPGGGAIEFSVLVVRMPTTGRVYTYALSANDKTPAEIVASGAVNADFDMCIESAALVASGNLGVRLNANAVNSSSVTFLSEDSC